MASAMMGAPKICPKISIWMRVISAASDFATGGYATQQRINIPSLRFCA
jgi:hypothetical protein